MKSTVRLGLAGNRRNLINRGSACLPKRLGSVVAEGVYQLVEARISNIRQMRSGAAGVSGGDPVPLDRRRTRAPSCLRRYAVVMPVSPAPTTTTSTSMSQLIVGNSGNVWVADQYDAVCMSTSLCSLSLAIQRPPWPSGSHRGANPSRTAYCHVSRRFCWQPSHYCLFTALVTCVRYRESSPQRLSCTPAMSCLQRGRQTHAGHAVVSRGTARGKDLSVVGTIRVSALGRALSHCSSSGASGVVMSVVAHRSRCWSFPRVPCRVALPGASLTVCHCPDLAASRCPGTPGPRLWA